MRMVVKWPIRLPEFRTTSRLHFHDQVVVPSQPDSMAVLSRFKKINASLLMRENHKCSNLAVIGPTPEEEWGTFGQGEQDGRVPRYTSPFSATEAGPWASALSASFLTTMSSF